MKRALIPLAVLTLLSGCASMSPDECKTADWYRVGYKDGQEGNNPSIINSYAEDCGEAGVTPDREQWKEGFDKGTILYCSPDNGYTVGIEGKEYYGVCSNKQFIENYQLGYQEYQRQQRIQEIDNEISIIDNQLDNNPDKDNAKRLKEKRKRLADERSNLLSPTINFNLNF
ncbi:DUF2799 domain-containing protein [Vibrio harveyi]|uniref:DUF2799 domain-containing protein n=1 Tax=Vibrio harveyi TaxID=669 RepID=UPI0025AFD588|nr:DUF2799 domain-containing protein [Vibrio harveyi]WJT10007.1 DUF2799 domain-containing protein [Vibrio harveyi]